jgi:hypothetical protein
VCKRCGHAEAQAAWTAWWEGLDLPIVMPREAESPLCPMCMTDLEEIAFLAGCRGARGLFAERFAVVALRIGERLRALLAAQTCEAES